MESGDYADEATPEVISRAEQVVGYKLPPSYVRLLQFQNGGYIERPIFPFHEKTSWADDYIHFDHVFGVGGEQGIDSETGSHYLIKEWDYPEVGVVINSDGHTAFMLDYSELTAEGEPRVIFVDTELSETSRTFILAPDFETFLSKLQPEDSIVFDDEARA